MSTTAHQSEGPSLKSLQVTNAGEGMEKREPFYTVVWNVSWYSHYGKYYGGSSIAKLVKNRPAMQETWVRSLGWEDPLEKGEATHSSLLAWRIPWTV